MSVPAARFAAQAKVNLALHIGGRGADGYHELATIFARVDLADDVVVRTLRSGTRIRVTRDGVPDESVGPAEKNLGLRAALAYMDEARWPSGCAIDIEKRIPVGAGLGGGSSDAGSVLRGLDSLAPRPLGEARLLRIAARLGADVPFLTSTAPLALGTGRGDVIEPLPALAPRWLAIVTPPFSVATADAYAWLDAHRESSRETPRLDAGSLRRGSRSWDDLAAIAGNDFDPVIAQRFPIMESYRTALEQAGARLAMLSGSGSAMFGLFENEPDVAEIARACNAPVLPARVPARVVATSGNE
ncbi:MAG TPA: 4-(cytidine 5'-diphospho)-2-C-methyl-D-erythritol kinase [Gemmatimonadaceae bacterium]|nr:4-(cytidine 5'-diphospho)-2-C-methyl-D-erythritol kinase [Gemmatimonadaceae bacterium]